VLDGVLADRIRFTPGRAQRRCTLTLPITFDRVLMAALPELGAGLQEMMASPTIPSWNQIADIPHDHAVLRKFHRVRCTISLHLAKIQVQLELLKTANLRDRRRSSSGNFTRLHPDPPRGRGPNTFVTRKLRTEREGADTTLGGKKEPGRHHRASRGAAPL
jgi:hypothetical protein